jgi:hypothetical protein
MEDMRLAVELAAEAPEITFGLSQKANYSELLWLQNGPVQGLEAKEEVVRVCAERGFDGHRDWLRAEALWLYYDLGRWDELLSESAAIAQQDGPAGVIAATYRAVVCLRRGVTIDAERELDALLAKSREIGDPQILLPVLVLASEVHQRQADVVTARRLLSELERTSWEQAVSFRARHLTDATRAALACGDACLAARLSEDLHVGAARDRHSLQTAEACLAEAANEPERAQLLYGEAAEGWRQYGHKLELGQALLGVARCRLALGLDREDSLSGARDIFAELGARPLLDAVEALAGEARAVGV